MSPMAEEEEAPTPGPGVIHLSEKEAPLCELAREEVFKLSLVVDRGSVDISKILALIEEGGDDIWDPKKQHGNIEMKRAGHDMWGVGKIVLIFSDDYLQRVFQLPWWTKWREHLSPIFQQLGIVEDRIVRCLFAMMPPKNLIPVHHDTGLWVSKTHRIHVPIVTNNLVEFKVGPCEKELTRVRFETGRIIELNNRAKHMVYNGSDTPRVHLIFDYVEDDFPLRTLKLQPTDVLMQTRRSVDLKSERGTREFPSFLIVGAQKAGTSSLYDFICQHPLVLKARRKESHYFDWRWNDKLGSLDKEENVRAHKAFYKNFFFEEQLLDHPSIMTGEATPSYLLGGSKVITRAKLLAPKAKIIIVLRDPVSRAFSHYNMTADPEGSHAQLRNRGHHALGKKTFQQVVEEELDELHELDITPEVSVKHFESAFLASRPQGHGGHSFLGRGLYAFQIEQWLAAYPRDQVMILSLDDMKGAEKTQATVNRVFEFLGLPHHVLDDTAPKNTRQYSPLSETLRSELMEFFKPYNQRLYELVGRDFAWD